MKASLPAPRAGLGAAGLARAADTVLRWPRGTHREGDDLEPLSDVEREHIVRALQHANGNKKKAASLLGVSRRALYRKLERLDLGVTIARRGQGAA